VSRLVLVLISSIFDRDEVFAFAVVGRFVTS
jgi:hypothetical protein